MLQTRSFQGTQTPLNHQKQRKKEFFKRWKYQKMGQVFQNKQKLKQQYEHWVRIDRNRINEEFICVKNILPHALEPMNMELKQHQMSQCLNCINCYYQNQPMPTTNQPYTFLNCRINDQVLIERLKAKMCALLNEGGGYLFITDEEKELVSGDQWLHQSAYQWFNFVYGLRQNIFPQNFKMEASEVDVVSRFNSFQQKKSMIRVAVVPQSDKFTFFTVKRVEKYKPTYICYFLNEQDKSKMNDINMVSYTCYLYSIIQSKLNTYYKQQTKGYPIKQSHRMCVKPNLQKNTIKQLALIFQVQPQKTQIETFHNSIQSATAPFNLVVDQEPRILHKFQALLILKAETDDGCIQSVQKQLRNNKLTSSQFMKPFMNHRSNSTKSIWFLSHECDFNIVKNVIDRWFEQLNLKFLAFISCTKYVMVQGQRYERLYSFEQVFKQYYGRSIKPAKSNYNFNKQTWDFCYSLESYQESVFAFIFIENLRIRSLFVNKTTFESMRLSMNGVV